MSWRTSYQLGMSELAVGSLVPAGGAAGLAFGAWALRKGGTPARDIARRTVALFLLTSAVNFVAVAAVGIAMWLGVGPDVSPALTLLPAVLAIGAIAAAPVVPFVASRRGWTNRAAVALSEGMREAGRVLLRRDWRVIAGSVGYWAFDNAVLWACLHAFAESPPITLVMMGYLDRPSSAGCCRFRAASAALMAACSARSLSTAFRRRQQRRRSSPTA